MIKILTAGALVVASFAMRMDVHDQTWNSAATLNDDQKQWDSFYRGSIKALGDSAAKEITTDGQGQTSIRYLDTTGNGD